MLYVRSAPRLPLIDRYPWLQNMSCIRARGVQDMVHVSIPSSGLRKEGPMGLLYACFFPSAASFLSENRTAVPDRYGDQGMFANYRCLLPGQAVQPEEMVIRPARELPVSAVSADFLRFRSTGGRSHPFPGCQDCIIQGPLRRVEQVRYSDRNTSYHPGEVSMEERMG